jgi:hypothetical protein
VSAQVLISERVHEALSSRKNGICSQLNANCVCGKTLEWKDLAFQRVTLLPRIFADGKVKLSFLLRCYRSGSLIKDLIQVCIEAEKWTFSSADLLQINVTIVIFIIFNFLNPLQ